MFEGVSAIAMPFFAVATILVLAELLFSYKTQSHLYSKQDTLCNLLIFTGARSRQQNNWHRELPRDATENGAL